MIEQIYQDFTTKMLPTIQEGLVITKDYFFDLFGRYVKYLIVVDSLTLFLSIVCLVVSVYAMYRVNKYGMQLSRNYDWNNYFDKAWPSFAIAGLVFASLFFIAAINASAKSLVKDIFIPEVRVYEELKDFKK